MLKSGKYLLLTTLMLLAFVASAWNMDGHVIITDMAQDELSSSVNQKINALTQPIFLSLPKKDQRFLNRAFANAPTLAKMSVLPDWWKKKPIGELFSQFGAILPANLKPYAHDTTSNWHFINHAYPTNSHCKVDHLQNVVFAIKLLEKSLQMSADPKAKGLVLIFLAHLVGDAHQPLHTMSHINAACWSDLGGNGFCLKKRKNGRCRYNLHEYWDNSLGLIKGKAHLAKWKSMIIQNTAANLPNLSAQAEDLNPNDWAKHNMNFAPFIYGTKEYHMPTATYRQKGQKLAMSQMRLAALRLRTLLSEWLNA